MNTIHSASHNTVKKSNFLMLIFYPKLICHHTKLLVSLINKIPRLLPGVYFVSIYLKKKNPFSTEFFEGLVTTAKRDYFFFLLNLRLFCGKYVMESVDPHKVFTCPLKVHCLRPLIKTNRRLVGWCDQKGQMGKNMSFIVVRARRWTMCRMSWATAATSVDL